MLDAIRKALIQWHDFIRNPDNDNLYEGNIIDPLVLKIRAALEARGIDPNSVYPVAMDCVANSDPMTVSLVISYDHYEGKA